MFKLGFFLFVLASLLAGFSQPENQGFDLVGYRVIMVHARCLSFQRLIGCNLQAIGAALLFNCTVAILAEQFAPHGQLALAQGVLWLFFAAGFVLGPVFGGVIGQADIRWIFWCTLLWPLFVPDIRELIGAGLMS